MRDYGGWEETMEGENRTVGGSSREGKRQWDNREYDSITEPLLAGWGW